MGTLGSKYTHMDHGYMDPYGCAVSTQRTLGFRALVLVLRRLGIGSPQTLALNPETLNPKPKTPRNPKPSEG